MARFNELDEQAQQQWDTRIAQKRLALSASVEETLKDTSEQEDQEPDEKSLSKIDAVPSAQPLEHTVPAARIERPQVMMAKVPPTPSTEVSASVRHKQHGFRRTTKVRLQVVPKPEEIQRTEELPLSLGGASTNPKLPAADGLVKTSGTIISQPRTAMSGSGTFESGQSEVAVANEQITPSSVVVVMLAGDPGPVVVQYVSLQPHMGFTVHLSAPTTHKTPFNYMLL